MVTDEQGYGKRRLLVVSGPTATVIALLTWVPHVTSTGHSGRHAQFGQYKAHHHQPRDDKRRDGQVAQRDSEQVHVHTSGRSLTVTPA